jgi:hypothetical protein
LRVQQFARKATIIRHSRISGVSPANSGYSTGSLAASHSSGIAPEIIRVSSLAIDQFRQISGGMKSGAQTQKLLRHALSGVRENTRGNADCVEASPRSD